MGELESYRTKLVQRSVTTLDDVNRVFADTGPYGNEICIVITPDTACCCTLLTSVPSGPFVLSQTCGADDGEFKSTGANWCMPGYKNISHVVSRQVFTFNAKPKSCPTRDSVFVDINLSINLAIGNEYDRVNAFVYQLGAERLDAYLVMQVEESIRTLVYGVDHSRVNDLRSEFATEMMRTLSSKLVPLGVDVRNVKITAVSLPQELQNRLEATTAFKTKIKEEAKNHEHRLQQISNDNEQKLAAIRQHHSIKQQQLKAEQERYEVTMDEKLSVAESNRKVNLEYAHAERQISVTKVKGEIDSSSYDARASKDRVISTAQISAEKMLHDASMQSKVKLVEAQSTESLAKDKAEEIIAVAEAQGKSAQKMEKKKIFEQKLKLATYDAQLAEKNRILLEGSEGANIIDSLISVRAGLAPEPTKAMSR